jgi:hypothetical protein
LKRREDDISQLRARIAEEKRGHDELIERDRKERERLKKEIEKARLRLNRGDDGNNEEESPEEEHMESKEQQPAVPPKPHNISEEEDIQMNEGKDNQEKQRKAEEARLKAEAERESALKKEEEAKVKAAQEAKKKKEEEAENARIQAEKDEAARKKKEFENLSAKQIQDELEASKRKAEEDKKKQQEEADAAKKKAEDEKRKQDELLAKKKAEDEKKKADDEKKKKIEAEMQAEKFKQAARRELLYAVKSAGIPPEGLEAKLIDKKELVSDRVSSDYLKNRLGKEPFKMYNQAHTDAVIYNVEKGIGHDQKEYNSTQAANEVRKFIGPYKILSPEEEKAQMLAITNVRLISPLETLYQGQRTAKEEPRR